MRNQISRAIIASNPGLPADAAEICQRVLAMREDMHPWLSANPEIAAPVWYTLWGKTRPEAAIAQGLVGRKLDSAQRNVVITKENRVGVLRTFIAHNELTFAEQQLLSGKANAAEALLDQLWLDPSLRKPLARKAGGLVLLREMAFAALGTFSSEELAELVATYPLWISEDGDLRRGARDRNRYLRILFGRHPELIGVVLDTPGTPGRHRQDLLTSIAGSANLTITGAERLARAEKGTCVLTQVEFDEQHYCLLALVNNPRCPGQVVRAVAARSHEVCGTGAAVGLFDEAAQRRGEREDITCGFEEIQDVETIGWVLRRSLPFTGENSTRPARSIELLALAKNPNLTPEQKTSVQNALRCSVEDELIVLEQDALRANWPDMQFTEPVHTRNVYRANAPGYVTEAFVLAAEQLGADPVRWETLIGLLDDYDGTFEELVSLSESI